MKHEIARGGPFSHTFFHTGSLTPLSQLCCVYCKTYHAKNLVRSEGPKRDGPHTIYISFQLTESNLEMKQPLLLLNTGPQESVTYGPISTRARVPVCYNLSDDFQDAFPFNAKITYVLYLRTFSFCALSVYFLHLSLGTWSISKPKKY